MSSSTIVCLAASTTNWQFSILHLRRVLQRGNADCDSLVAQFSDFKKFSFTLIAITAAPWLVEKVKARARGLEAAEAKVSPMHNLVHGSVEAARISGMERTILADLHDMLESNKAYFPEGHRRIVEIRSAIDVGHQKRADVTEPSVLAQQTERNISNKEKAIDKCFSRIAELKQQRNDIDTQIAAEEEKITFLTEVFSQANNKLLVPITLFLKYFFGYFSPSLIIRLAAK